MLLIFQFRDDGIQQEQLSALVQNSTFQILCQRWIIQPGEIPEEVFKSLTEPPKPAPTKRTTKPKKINGEGGLNDK